jgi:hypothetical protein
VLTDEEVGLISTAILHGPFPPKPDYLPTCHRLAERGWLERTLLADQVCFQLGERGVAALELGIPLAEAKEARN